MTGWREQEEGRRKSRAKRNDTQPDEEHTRTVKIDGPPTKVPVIVANGFSLLLNTVCPLRVQTVKKKSQSLPLIQSPDNLYLTFNESRFVLCLSREKV